MLRKHSSYDLIDILCKMVIMAFKNRKRLGFSKISLRYKDARWVKKSNLNFPITMNEFEIQDIIGRLFNCNFIQVGERVYSQKNGIPMGFSCSPVMCNLYFVFFEYNFVVKNAKLKNKEMLESMIN